jgi:hypothetical protein
MLVKRRVRRKREIVSILGQAGRRRTRGGREGRKVGSKRPFVNKEGTDMIFPLLLFHFFGYC